MLTNAWLCLLCMARVESIFVRDYQECLCGRLAVTGGITFPQIYLTAEWAVRDETVYRED